MIYNDTYKNVLLSYAYGGKSPSLNEKTLDLSRKKIINVMIDSGAFTKFNAKQDILHINLNDYCDYLKDCGNYVEKYVMLDVVGNAIESRRNYENMVNKGLTPMFVATMFDNDYDYINETLSVNRNICVAGGVTTKGTWMTRRFQQIYKRSGKKALIHGLGYVTFPKMLQLNLASVDSSSWNTGPQCYGSIQYFHNGLKVTNFANIKRKGIPNTLKDVLNFCNIKASDFFNPKYAIGNKNIQGFISLVGNVMMQKYCYKRGLRYFLAISSNKSLSKYLYVCDNLSQLNYSDYRKI